MTATPSAGSGREHPVTLEVTPKPATVNPGATVALEIRLTNQRDDRPANATVRLDWPDNWQLEQGPGGPDENADHSFDVMLNPGASETRLVAVRPPPGAAGDHQIDADVIDDEGRRVHSDIPVSVNRKPTAVIRADSFTPFTNQTVVFTANLSNDSDGRIESYSWDLDGDGRTDKQGDRVTWKYREPGRKFVELVVKDEYGLRAKDTDPLVVRENEPPTVRFTSSLTDPQAKNPLTLNATGTHDSHHDVMDYRWYFDGNLSFSKRGRVVNKTFATPGYHTIRLVAEDELGATNETVREIFVSRNTPPVVLFYWKPSVPDAGYTTRLIGSLSKDPGDTIDEWRWDVDSDGRPDLIGEHVNHKFTEPGTHNVTLFVTDDSGNTGKETISIQVDRNDRPQGNFTHKPIEPEIGYEVTFEVTRKFDPEGGPVSVEWSINPDQSINPTKTVVNYIFKSDGNHSVTLYLTDESGNTRNVTKFVAVDWDPWGALRVFLTEYKIAIMSLIIGLAALFVAILAFLDR